MVKINIYKSREKLDTTPIEQDNTLSTAVSSLGQMSKNYADELHKTRVKQETIKAERDFTSAANEQFENIKQQFPDKPEVWEEELDKSMSGLSKTLASTASSSDSLSSMQSSMESVAFKNKLKMQQDGRVAEVVQFTNDLEERSTEYSKDLYTGRMSREDYEATKNVIPHAELEKFRQNSNRKSHYWEAVGNIKKNPYNGKEFVNMLKDKENTNMTMEDISKLENMADAGIKADKAKKDKLKDYDLMRANGLSSRNTKDRKLASDYYGEDRNLIRAFSSGDEAAIQKTIDMSKMLNMIPEQPLRAMNSWIESNNPEDNIKGYEMINKFRAELGDDYSQFGASGDYPKQMFIEAEMYSNLVTGSEDDPRAKESAVATIMTNKKRLADFSPDDRKLYMKQIDEVIENKFSEKDIKKHIKYVTEPNLPGTVISRLFDGKTYPEAEEISEGSLSEAASETKALLKEYAILNGGKVGDKELEFARNFIKTKYGTTSITGGSAFMKYPPEKYYKKPAAEKDWIKKQLEDVIKEYAKGTKGYQIISDIETENSLRNDGRPNYGIIVRNEDTGAMDTLPIRFAPNMDFNEEKDNLYIAKEKDFEENLNMNVTGFNLADRD